MTSPSITDYESKRLANIQRNLDFMKSMGVSTAKLAARTKTPISKGQNMKRKLVKIKAEPKLPTRKSRRLQQNKDDGHENEPLVQLEFGKEMELKKENVKIFDNYRLEREFQATALNLSPESHNRLLKEAVEGVDIQDMSVDDSGIETIEYTLREEHVVKAAMDRIYSMTFHPRADKVMLLCGDKIGHLSLWHAPFSRDVKKKEESDSIAIYRPHTSPISSLQFCPHEPSRKLLSSSYDGSVRQFDFEAAQFTELFALSDKDVSITSMSASLHLPGIYLLSCDDGIMMHVDDRSPSHKQTSYLLHEKKIQTVHCHPTMPYCIATASLDRTACLWDLRHIKKSKQTITSKPLVMMPHHRSVNCAYFSPTGEHLVTVGLDDRINIFDTEDASHTDPMSVAPSRSIRHNNQTGRWLTKFHAAWDPKRPTQYAMGCMEQPRRIQIFDAIKTRPIQELKSDYFGSVHSINAYHPTLPLLAGGNSSGKLSLWAPDSLKNFD